MAALSLREVMRLYFEEVCRHHGRRAVVDALKVSAQQVDYLRRGYRMRHGKRTEESIRPEYFEALSNSRLLLNEALLRHPPMTGIMLDIAHFASAHETREALGAVDAASETHPHHRDGKTT